MNEHLKLAILAVNSATRRTHFIQQGLPIHIHDVSLECCPIETFPALLNTLKCTEKNENHNHH